MSMIWIALAVLIAAAGIRSRRRVRAHTRSGGTRIDDEAIRRIIDEGELGDAEAERRADREAAAEAEEEFWDEYWDEPEEYGR